MDVLEQRKIYLYNFLNRIYFNIGQTRPDIINETEYYIQSYYNQHVKNPSQINIRLMQQDYMDIYKKYTDIFSNKKNKVYAEGGTPSVNQCYKKIINDYNYIPSLSSYEQSLFELNKLYNCIINFNNVTQVNEIIEIPLKPIIIEKPENPFYNPYIINYNWNMVTEKFSNNNLNNKNILSSNNIIIVIIIIILIAFIYNSK